MIKKGITFLSALLLLFAASLGSAQEKPPKQGEKVTIKKNVFTDSTKAIQVVRSSPTVTLKLKSNPSTGYSWFLVQYDQSVMTPISRKFFPGAKEMPGAPGYEIWRFSVNRHAFFVPQITHLTLKYLRPWVVPTNGRKLTFTIAIQEMAEAKAK